MADIFMSQNVKNLLKNKKIVLIGDSNMRAAYKDLICLYQKDALLTVKLLKSKMDKSILNDKLVDHGKLSKGRDFKEHRRFTSDNVMISYFFVTRVYNAYVEGILKSFKEKGSPDLIIVNSCLWDICRWGPKGVETYRLNLSLLMKRFNEILDKNCMVIWLTTPPISQELKGGFLVSQLEFLQYSLRFHVLEANNYARQVVVRHGYDILDVHYHLRMQLTQRAGDGIHWLPLSVRHVTNLLLTHISLAWGVPLPHNFDSVITQRLVEAQDKNDVELNYDEPQPAANGGQSSGALKDIKNESRPASSLKAPTKSRKPADIRNKGFHTSYHAFKKRKQIREAQQRIRQWKYSHPLMPTPVVSPIDSPMGSPIRPMMHSPLCSPFLPQNTPPTPSYLSSRYGGFPHNHPVPFQFSYDPGFTQPQFNWTRMREMQFARFYQRF